MRLFIGNRVCGLKSFGQKWDARFAFASTEQLFSRSLTSNRHGRALFVPV